jgi:hypothetical protein
VFNLSLEQLCSLLNDQTLKKEKGLLMTPSFPSISRQSQPYRIHAVEPNIQPSSLTSIQLPPSSIYLINMSSNQSGGRTPTHQEKLLGELSPPLPQRHRELMSLSQTEYCRVKGISTPTFNIVSDRRGEPA